MDLILSPGSTTSAEECQGDEVYMHNVIGADERSLAHIGESRGELEEGKKGKSRAGSGGVGEWCVM